MRAQRLRIMTNRKWNLALGVLFFTLSTLTLFIWIPADTETGLVIEARRSTDVGDALAPSFAALAVLLLSIALILTNWKSKPLPPKSADPSSGEQPIGITRANAAAIATLTLIITISLALMVWLGPLTIQALQSLGFDVPNYRLLTATPPYKYIGFAAGGLVLVGGLIAWIEGRLRWQALATALGTVILLIVIYDVPFDNLLLPPNGSQ